MDLDSYLTNKIRKNTYTESKRKLLNLELARRKRNEINDLINKELRIKQGATNLLKVCQNDQAKERLRLELTFVDSNIRYLKDQLSELNCNWTLYKMKNSQLKDNYNGSGGSLSGGSRMVSLSSSCSSSSSGGIAATLAPPTPKPLVISTSSKIPIYLKQFDPLPEFSNNGNNCNQYHTAVESPEIYSHATEFIPISIPALISTTHVGGPSHQTQTTTSNSYSFSPSSSSSISVQTNTVSSNNSSSSTNNSNTNNINFVYVTGIQNPTKISMTKMATTPTTSTASRKCRNNLAELESAIERVKACSQYNEFSLDECQTKSADIMIYLNLKETYNKVDFTNGFSNFIAQHYRDDPIKYSEQIRQFNYFRESTIRLSYEPSNESISRLFEYFNSLHLIEKRFFQNSQCKQIYFTWYDSLNGIESTQKSIQFEKASILFNCATLLTQMAAICCDGNSFKLQDQLNYWLKAAGCLDYLNTNFSNSPSLDMCSYVLYFFTDIFMCQSYEIKSKLLLYTNSECDAYDPKHIFVTYIKCSRLYSYISEKYSEISLKLSNNLTIKNYLPEIWFYLIKVKSIYYKGLSHYYAALAISTNGLERVWDNLEVESLFDDLHDKAKISCLYKATNTSNNNISPNKYSTCPHQSYFQKQIAEQNLLYDYSVLRSEKRILLAKAHMRESIVWQEEAIRQHGFCRKFTKDDYLHHLLRHYHDISLDKFMQLENLISCEMNDELFDLLPINSNLNEKLMLKATEPNFNKYECKDFFNLIGPLKIYSSEIELSVPFSCILRKLPYQQTFGITVKGDCPVRINQVDKQSYAYSAGIREGDFIIAIQDQDVKWSKHIQVVERIRSNINSVKLTLVSAKILSKEMPIFCDDAEKNKLRNCSDQHIVNKPEPAAKMISSPKSGSANEKHQWWKPTMTFIESTSEQTQPSPPKTPKLHQRLFRLPNTSSKTNTPIHMPLNDSFSNAANRLCNLARGASSSIKQQTTDWTTTFTKKSASSASTSKSVQNLNNVFDNKIQFNEEDDEISNRENQVFWQSLKNLKTPFTNTITLGRKFRKNVLKLNIFNSFSANSGIIPPSNVYDSSTTKLDVNNTDEPPVKLKNAKDDDDDDVQLKMIPTLPPQTPRSKHAKIKLTRKQKKLNKLETQHLLDSGQANQLVYKTI